MKRDRSIDHHRVRHKPGVGFCRCPVCADLADRAMRKGEDHGFGLGEVPPGCKHINTEAIFAEKWEKENHPTPGLNGGDGILSSLMRTRARVNVNDPDPNLLLFEKDPTVTRRERVVAATVIQWLGTNVGWCFLTQCLSACGFLLVEESAYERQVQGAANARLHADRQEMETRLADERQQMEKRIAEAEAARDRAQNRFRAGSMVALGRFETLEGDGDGEG